MTHASLECPLLRIGLDRLALPTNFTRYAIGKPQTMALVGAARACGQIAIGYEPEHAQGVPIATPVVSVGSIFRTSPDDGSFFPEHPHNTPLMIEVQTKSRGRITQLMERDGVLWAKITELPPTLDPSPEEREALEELLSDFRELVRQSKNFVVWGESRLDSRQIYAYRPTDQLDFAIAAALRLDPIQEYQLLAEDSLLERIRRVQRFLGHRMRDLQEGRWIPSAQMRLALEWQAESPMDQIVR
jgi:ATP-dependent Lon protease